jgi:hypothetical protein
MSPLLLLIGLAFNQFVSRVIFSKRSEYARKVFGFWI